MFCDQYSFKHKECHIPRTVIRNLTKRCFDKIYGPRRWVAQHINEECDIVWLSHWAFKNNDFEDGDEVSVDVADFANIYDHVHVKEYGLSVVYDDDGNKREDLLANYTSWKLRIGCDLYFFQFKESN